MESSDEIRKCEAANNVDIALSQITSDCYIVEFYSSSQEILTCTADNKNNQQEFFEHDVSMIDASIIQSKDKDDKRPSLQPNLVPAKKKRRQFLYTLSNENKDKIRNGE